MRDLPVAISRATRSDLEEILNLLAAVNLPPEGVAEHLGGFLLARDASDRLIGCAGLERYGQLGLLRSVAVLPGLQRTGLGSMLIARLLDEAAEEGAREIVLLTTTARDFFASRFGFEEANRAAYDSRLSRSPEWLLPRCSSAAFMRLTLPPPSS